MAYTQAELNRIAALFERIEGNKAHENAAPTWRDSPDLRKMAEIVSRHAETDGETLEETIPALWYLTESYDKMGRAGMSAKFYTPQLEAHVKLMQQRPHDRTERERLESCFYLAVKARNFYEPDDCADLIAIVANSLPERKRTELLRGAQESRRDAIQNDPVEKSEEYLAVIDRVEQRADENKTMDFCLAFWNRKSAYLAEYGIFWRSPAQLNPGVLFD